MYICLQRCVCEFSKKKKLSCFFLFRGRPFLPCHCASSTPALLRFFTLNLVHSHCLSKLPSPSIQQALSLLQAAASVVVDLGKGGAAVLGVCCLGLIRKASRWWSSTKGGVSWQNATLLLLLAVCNADPFFQLWLSHIPLVEAEFLWAFFWK